MSQLNEYIETARRLLQDDSGQVSADARERLAELVARYDQHCSLVTEDRTELIRVVQAVTQEQQ